MEIIKFDAYDRELAEGEIYYYEPGATYLRPSVVYASVYRRTCRLCYFFGREGGCSPYRAPYVCLAHKRADRQSVIFVELAKTERGFRVKRNLAEPAQP
jgi:hypothetical protein